MTGWRLTWRFWYKKYIYVYLILFYYLFVFFYISLSHIMSFLFIFVFSSNFVIFLNKIFDERAPIHLSRQQQRKHIKFFCQKRLMSVNYYVKKWIITAFHNFITYMFIKSLIHIYKYICIQIRVKIMTFWVFFFFFSFWCF